jgi:hypothetical protein
MRYCSSCGQPIAEGARFCASCGTTVTGQSPTPLAATPTPAPVTKVVIVEPKRGGMLALKGFLLSLVLAVMVRLGHSSDESGPTLVRGIFLDFGITDAIGAVYIILSLLKWKGQRDTVKGEALAWIIAVVLVFSTISAVMASGGSQTLDQSPKDVLMRDVKLDSKWQKSGFGNVMIADFTVHNPTQLRFKDFEVTCTHRAPSGTKIDSNTRTIYEVVEPNSTKQVNEMNMGFIDSQVASSHCEITDLVPIP